MKALPTTVLAIFITAIMFPGAAVAQQRQGAVQPTGLALEIVYYKDTPPAFQSVPPSDSRPSGAWFGRFGRVASWQPPAGALPVRAVNVVSRKEGDAVRINVSVFVGVKFHDKEEPVATYLVRENERVIIDELTRFGVEPFEIGVVGVRRSTTVMPSVVTRSESIIVEAVEVNDSTLPSYRLTLRNTSSKNIVGLQTDVLVGGKTQLTGQHQGKEGLPLIKAGGDYQVHVPGAKNALMTDQGYRPHSPQAQSIVIVTALFEDVTYEGDALAAARLRARLIGQKAQLAQVIKELDDLMGALESGGPATVEIIRERVTSLRDDVDMAAVDKMMKDFPGLNRPARDNLGAYYQVARHGIKKGLLKEIDQFENDQTGAPDRETFRAWLSATKERYKQWLSGL
jgi:hypothetical protein